MTLEKVIEAGKLGISDKLDVALETMGIGIFMILLPVGIMVAIVIYSLVTAIVKPEVREDMKETISFLSILIIMALGTLGTIIFLLVDTEIESDFGKEWADNYVIPYMDELDDVTYEVKSIEISGTKKDLLEAKTIGTSYEDAIVVDILYIDEDNKTKSMSANAIIHYVLDDDEKEYIIMKELEEDLGNSITPGYYNPVIYLKK